MNKSEKQRIELSVHTNMSALDGVSSAREYIDAAIKEKMPAIAITDICSVWAFHEAYRFATDEISDGELLEFEIKNKMLRPIIK